MCVPCFGQKRLRTARPSGCHLERPIVRHDADKAQNSKDSSAEGLGAFASDVVDREEIRAAGR